MRFEHGAPDSKPIFIDVFTTGPARQKIIKIPHWSNDHYPSIVVFGLRAVYIIYFHMKHKAQLYNHRGMYILMNKYF